jgi:hypothetical protein
MLPSVNGLVRVAALLVLTAGVSACVAGGAQMPGPPPIKLKQVGSLGPAPVRGVETVRFAFATLTGVPAEQRFAMEKLLKSYAATRNLMVLPEGAPTATYQIKGYLSAVGDKNGTLLVYTWDVYDAQGVTRLHRISGQQTGAGSEMDPWVGIRQDELNAAARETIDKLADWVRG